jgi:hypothetical protein
VLHGGGEGHVPIFEHAFDARNTPRGVVPARYAAPVTAATGTASR